MNRRGFLGSMMMAALSGIIPKSMVAPFPTEIFEGDPVMYPYNSYIVGSVDTAIQEAPLKYWAVRWSEMGIFNCELLKVNK